MKVSIIVPVYNVEKQVSKCIDSILAQTYKNWELLLIDDGSTDTSADICEEYAKKDNRIKVFRNKHSGVSVMRNIGIRNSTGAFVSFVDSDDQIETNFIEKAITKCLEKNIDIYMAGVRGIKEGKEVARGVVKEIIYSNSKDFTEKQIIELLEQNYTASCCGKLFLKEKIGEIRFDENFIFGEDLIFVHELLKKDVIVFADTYIGYNYFKRGGSLITTVSIKKCEDIIKTYLYLLKTKAEFNCTEKGYLEFLKNRCVLDLNFTQISILEGKDSVINKYKKLKVLFSQEKIVQILKEDIGKTRLDKYSFHPAIVLLRYYGRKIKKRI